MWFIAIPVLAKVLQRWCHSQQQLLGDNFNVYTDLLHKLKTNPTGKVEVDDFLWIVMIQWAKLAAWSVKRIATKATAIERGLAMKPESHRKALVFMPPMQLAHLKAVVESIYPPAKQVAQAQAQPHNASGLSGGVAQDLVDSVFIAASYINRITISRANMVLSADVLLNSDPLRQDGGGGGATAKTQRLSTFSKEFNKLLTGCILWDTNSNLFKRANPNPNPGEPSRVASNATAAILSTQLDSKPTKAQRVSFLRSDSSLTGIATGPVEYRPPILNCPAILLAVNPAQSYAAVRKAFVSYQSTINSFVAKVATAFGSFHQVLFAMIFPL